MIFELKYHGVYVLNFSHARIQLVQTPISTFLSWRS